MNDDIIKNKKILFISIPHYGYEEVIKREIEKLGAEVDYFPGKFHPESFRENFNFFSALCCFLKNPLYKQKYTRALLEFIDSQAGSYDILFVIQMFPASFKAIKKLKQQNKKIKTYIFFWDKIDLYGCASVIKYFDYAFCFDRSDAKKYPELRFLHDFYLPHRHEEQRAVIYDWSYIGSLNQISEYRIDFLSKLIEDSKKNNLSYYARLRYRLPVENKFLLSKLKNCLKYVFLPDVMAYHKKIKNNLYKGFLFSDSITLEETEKIQSRSKCIVDISYRGRYGLTLHCLSAVASNKKLITTNKHIAEEDFYRPDNISIVDEQNPSVDIDFLNKPTVPVDISYLRLDNWLKTIFGASLE